MTRYLISFPGDAMAHIPEEEGPAVADAAHAVVQEAKDAGVFVLAGGLDEEGGSRPGGRRRYGHRRYLPVGRHHDYRRALT